VFQARVLNLTFDMSSSGLITAMITLRTTSEVCTLECFYMFMQVSIPKDETGLNNQYE